MIDKLSTQRFVCILKDGSKFFLDEKEAKILKNTIRSGADYFEIGDSLISKNDFSRVIGSENYEQTERIKRGEWKCQLRYWHSRGQECGHTELNKY